ncbi:MAG: hypothetical protein ITG02_07610 [Patulibacter sp.]|nr:hypothetical protein [Patulibacter sp.]
MPNDASLRRVLAGALIWLVAAASVGVVAAAGYAAWVALAALAVGATWFGRRHLSYVVPALLLLAAMNGVLGVNLEGFALPGAFKATDLVFGAIVAFALTQWLSGVRFPGGSLQQVVVLWAAVFGCIWALVLVRTLWTGVPLGMALSYGRDIVYLALLAPVAGLLFRDRNAVTRCAGVVAGLTALYAVVLVLAALGLVPPTAANAHITRSVGSVARIYTFMSVLIPVVFFGSLAYALMNRGRMAQAMAFVAAATGAAVVMQLTRAAYLGVGLGTFIAVLPWAAQRGFGASAFRRRLRAGALVVVLVATASVVIEPAVMSSAPVSAVTSRLQTNFGGDQSLPASDDTIAYRTRLTATMLQRLGDAWPIGLGFQHPGYRYFVDVPAGSIRNPDVGIINGLMLLGVAGSLVYYFPVVFLFWVALRRSHLDDFSADSWFWFTCLASTVYVFATILTLGTLFYVSGIVMVGFLLGAAARMVPSDGSRSEHGAPPSGSQSLVDRTSASHVGVPGT